MELVKYEAARHALMVCATVDEAKNILDKASALQAYARQQNNTDMEIWVAEMKIRARRRIGEISKELDKSKGGSNPNSTLPIGGKSKSEVLKDAGLSISVANRCEKLSEVPIEDFENEIKKAKDEGKPLTLSKIKGNTHVAQNSGNNEWYTPSEFIKSASDVMGDINLDPASSQIANETVNADKFHTIDDSGLDHEWRGNIWLNPPYAQPLISDFANKIVMEIGTFNQLIVLINNATETKWFQKIAKEADCLCFPSSRIKFIDMDGLPKGAPLQGQCFLYFGNSKDKFISEFSKYGFVVTHA